ncbi:MAG: sigma-70 family RNA polymerase sigma factor, partial [Candidatus Zixiibacteriota bacterium]
MANRLIFCEWFLTRDYGTREHTETELTDAHRSAEKRTGQIRRAVRDALARLPETERELIEQFYFIGTTLPEIAAQSGRSVHRLESLLHRAVRR